MMAAAVYFIGHLQSTAREYWLQGVDIKWWTRLIVALVALLFPDLQSFNLTDDVIAGAPIPGYPPGEGCCSGRFLVLQISA